MKQTYLFIVNCFLLVYAIKGKACPEKTRPHKSHCEAYYKCVDLPPRRHVWIPEKCEEGLVYEHKLYMCVLPPDDWECLPTIEIVGNNVNPPQVHDNHVKPNTDSNILLIHNTELDDDLSIVKNKKHEISSVEIITTKALTKEDQYEEAENAGEEMLDDDVEGVKDTVEGSGSAEEQLEIETNDRIERKDASTEAQPFAYNLSKIDPKLRQQLQHLSQLVQGLKQEQEHKNALDLRPDHLNTFLTSFNIKNNYNALGSAENYKISPISSTTPPPSPTNGPQMQVQLPVPDLNSSLNKHTLEPETKLLLSSIFGYNDYMNSQLLNNGQGSLTFSLPSYHSHQQSQETPNMSEETLKTILELSNQLIVNQNVPKVVPNSNYFKQAIIQPVIVPASSIPYHPSLFSLNADYNFQKHPNSYKKKYKPSHKKPSHTIINNNVHVNAPHSIEKDGVVDSYGLYPPLSVEDQYANGGTKLQNNIYASITTMRPTVSTEISVTTAVPFDFQVTPSTIANYFTPSPYLNDATANKLFYDMERYPSYNVGNQYENKRPYKPTFIDHPAPLFPPQIDPNKIKIRPNAQHYDSHEQNSAEYFYQSQIPGSYNNYPNYFIPSTTTSRQSIYGFNSYSRPSSFDGANLVRFGGNFVSFDTFQKTILPLLGPSSDLGQVEFIQCATGVRQANVTDCTRYYVCSKKDGKILTYSCPPYTAFNAMTRICDARTYASCLDTQKMQSAYGSSNTLYALQAVQRRREQALKSQAISQMLQYNDEQSQGTEEDDNYIEAPSVFSSPITSSTTSLPTRKRKYFCKEGDKIADQTSLNSYFVCYKNENGRMKGHKMSCPNSLVFCAANSICTLSERCK